MCNNYNQKNISCHEVRAEANQKNINTADVMLLSMVLRWCRLMANSAFYLNHASRGGSITTFNSHKMTNNNKTKRKSNYGYAWPDANQIKGSVCHSKGVDLVA